MLRHEALHICLIFNPASSTEQWQTLTDGQFIILSKQTDTPAPNTPFSFTIHTEKKLLPHLVQFFHTLVLECGNKVHVHFYHMSSCVSNSHVQFFHVLRSVWLCSSLARLLRGQKLSTLPFLLSAESGRGSRPPSHPRRGCAK